MENNEVELTEEQLEVEKQKIRDNVNGVSSDTDDDIKLPSDENEEPRKYAGVYENIDELKKGIINLKEDVPDYILNGMNEDALEQYYTDLRKEFSSRPKEEEVVEETNEDKPTDVISDDLWKELDAEYMANGGISEEQYEKLNKLGIPNQVIDKYIDGLRSEAVQFTNQVFELAGGEEEYNNIKAWAEENYTQEELDIIGQGSYKDILFKMKAVKADYMEKNGGNTRLVGSSKTSVKGYNDQAEYLRDVMSPEYRRNSKYKAKVDEKFKNSKFAS